MELTKFHWIAIQRDNKVISELTGSLFKEIDEHMLSLFIVQYIGNLIVVDVDHRKVIANGEVIESFEDVWGARAVFFRRRTASLSTDKHEIINESTVPYVGIRGTKDSEPFKRLFRIELTDTGVTLIAE